MSFEEIPIAIKVEQPPKRAKYQIIPAYIGELRSKIGYYIGWVPNEYADQVAADNAYDLLKNDSAIAHALHLHSCMAGGEKWRINAEDEQLKFIISKLLRRITDFVHARKSLVENGVLLGLGMQRKYYEQFEMREYPGLIWTGIKSIKEVDRRRVRLEREDDSKTDLYWTIWCPKIDQYIIIEDRHDNPHIAEGAALQDYIWYFHEREELNPYFRGLGQILYPLAYIKKYALQYWGDLSETWAKPWIVGLMDAAKGILSGSIGTDIKTLEERTKSFLEMLEKARGRHAIVVDKSDQIDIKEHGSQGNNIIGDLMKYCDEKIQLLLLGAELTTGTGSGAGSYALGNVHRQQTETLIMYSRSRLQEVLLRDVVYDLLYRNRMNLYRLGLDAPEPGDVDLELYIEMEEKKEQALERSMTGYHGNMEKII